MAISGFTPTTALPGLVPGAQLAGSNPLLAAQGGVPLGTAQLAAQAGVGEKPGIVSRFMNAMRAAVGELRGVRPADDQIRSQVLAMQAQQPVTLAKKPVTTKAKTFTDKQGNVRQVGTGKIIKPAAGAAPSGAATQPVSAGSEQLPTNATQLPGATMYSYDANGNPVAAPTMAQLGMTPTMLQGLTGLAGGVDPEPRPQMNATNQTNLSGIGSGLGSAVPVLGAPILTTSPGDTGTAPAAGSGTSGGTQSVTNRNATDINNRNQGLGYPYGGYGGFGDPTGGIATPFAPYGPSMTGAYEVGRGSSLLSRIF
jgi:hypothetical protein